MESYLSEEELKLEPLIEDRSMLNLLQAVV
jgi:hypothetical protein